ncbi:MAG: ABC transporter ATP-binding protein [Chromatiales bacterium]|jgi:ATP-binding cassette, subfamily B, multidrug efflux pump|nr:ABC transporter ATP-binding protein [Chromatiales bacterium]
MSGPLTQSMMRWLSLSEHLPALYRILKPTLREHRWHLIVVAALIPISTAMATLIPYLTKIAVDDYVLPALQGADATQQLDGLWTLAGFGFAAVVLGYLADALYVQVLQRVGQRLIAELRRIVYAHTLRLSRSYYDRNPVGSLLTRVTSDIEALGESLASNVLSMLVDLLKSAAFITVMFYMSWELTAVLLLGTPALVLVIRFFQARVRRSFFRARQALAEATGYLQEVLNGMKTVQLYNAETKVIRQYEARNRRFYNAQNDSNLYDALLFSVVEGITTFALALVLWHAARAALAGVLTLGTLVAFMEYIQRLFIPVRELSQQLAVLQRAMAALDHIGGLFSEPPDRAEPHSSVKEGSAAIPVFDNLSFRDVRFRYRPHGPEILRGINFELKRGRTMAIVGATGSGKSSLIRLLTRAHGGYEGSIELNEAPLTDYSLDILGRMISVVHQDVFLFHGSVAFNISLDRPGIDRKAIEQAAAYVHADAFIRALPGGYDFEVAHGGANLSSGQCQLIAFARAVAAQTEVMILDEATSSVDSVTEVTIEQALAQLYKDKTVIAIAHRLSTIRNADLIVVLDAGEIVESGDHETLMALEGHYHRLIRHATPATQPSH